jgi:hypothetical protein
VIEEEITMTETNITGRDGIIIAEALATAIVALSRLPTEHRPDSNIQDMRTLLHSSPNADMWINDAIRRFGADAAIFEPFPDFFQ